MPNAPSPAADPLVALAERCVQCGLCLPACPTYGLDRLEAESPRGRIALVKAWAQASVPTTPAGDLHLDHCLGCRSCEAVCPAGVEYGALLVQARSRQRERRPPGWRQRLALGLVARPRLLSRLLELYRRLHPVLPTALRPLPPPLAHTRQSPDTRANGPRAAVFVGCVAGPYEAGLRDAVTRLCAAAGIAVTQPAGQTCCGSLHAHSGDTGRAQQLAAVNRRAFAGAEPVLTLASGCHESLARSLAGEAQTVDAIEFLARHAGALRWRAGTERIALHLPCTQRNVVRSVPALRRLLAQVPGLTVIELDAGYGCCGAAGLQMLDDPSRAAQFREPLLQQLIQSKATRLLSANIGCRLHLAQAAPVPVQHPLEFLAQRLDTSPSPPHATVAS